MFSTFPSTPGRGRSRFSKALPTAPGDASKSPDSSSSVISKYMHSPLPPLPKEKEKMAMAIPRRPVGGNAAGIESSKAPSIKSVSSVYSDSPGLSRSLSDTSTKDSLSGVDSDAGPTPPLPPKDSQRPQNSPTTPNKLANGALPNFNPSPPRTELWKRRSVSSNKSISLTDLKLQKSNGSTASPPKNQEPPADRGLPRSITGRKPVPARPAPPQPDLMGNKISKLRNKSQGEKGDTAEHSSQNEAPNQTYPAIQRPPTPEYPKADKHQPSTPQVLSPRSPFTPPDDEKAPALPQKSDSRAKTIQSDLPRSDSQATTIRPNISSSNSSENSESHTITSEAPILLAPHPEKPFAARLLTPQLSPDKTSPLVLPSPSHRIHFPSVQSPAAKGTIFPGPPLSVVHFKCFQSHKLMRSTRNTLCPVACMICKKKDTEIRWKCTWCCLSACGSCMQVLSSIPGKDLETCVERVGK
jgi:hypothetical protein